jgi:hypothetical protein
VHARAHTHTPALMQGMLQRQRGAFCRSDEVDILRLLLLGLGLLPLRLCCLLGGASDDEGDDGDDGAKAKWVWEGDKETGDWVWSESGHEHA